MASYRIEFTRSASKDLRSIDRQWIRRILEAVEALAGDPRPSGCKKLVGAENSYRIRVGDFRVIYEIQDGLLLVLVVKVGHRRDVCR